MKWIRDPLLWLVLCFVALLFLMPHSGWLFSALFPELPRPVYLQESFISLTLAHFWLVGVSSVVAMVLGVGAGIIVTRPAGIAPGRWSPHAKLAVRHLEQRHFALPIALGAARRPPPSRSWTVAPAPVTPEGEWSCR